MTELWVERTGVRRYTGRSSRGAEVLVGNEDVEGVFTPGELMKIALAACSGMSSDAPLRRRLGDDYKTTIKVSGPPTASRSATRCWRRSSSSTCPDSPTTRWPGCL
jgi:Predicted redox protein, regulator of disulfide bond formation